MPQTNRPTEGKFQTAMLALWARAKKLLPSKQDPVTAAVAIPAGIVLFVLHGKGVDVVPMAAALALALIAPTATWLGGKYRVAAVTVACFLMAAIVASTWRQGRYWLLIPAALVVWVPWSIGRTRRKPAKHAAILIKQGLAMVSEGLAAQVAAEYPEGVKVAKASVGRSGTAVVVPGHISTSSGRGNASVAKDAHHSIAARLANRCGLPTKALTAVDLSATKAAGAFELAFPLVQPFACPEPTKPKATMAGIPLGWDGYGNPYVLDIANDDAQHLLVFGTSGAGKSNFLRGLIQDWKVGAGAQIWACDPKGGQGLRASRWADVWSVSDADAAHMLASAAVEMVRREREVGEGNQYDGQWLVVVVDECDSVMNKTVAPHVKMIIKRGRSSRVALIMGLQSSRVDGVGGGDVLANFVTRIGFRTTSDLEDRQGFSTKNEPGYETHKIDRADKGRFVAKGLPTHDRLVLQAWPAPNAPEGVELAPSPVDPVRPLTTGGSPHAGHSAPESPESGPGIRPDRTGPEMPDAWALLTDHVATRTPKERIVDGLDDDPMTITEVMARSGLGKSRAYEVMKELCGEGHARPVKGGWVRA